MEYEIKVVGSKPELVKVLRNFMLILPDSIRDRHYSFNTYYLDANSSLFKAGYSLRHRTGAYEINKAAGTEIKAVEGAIGQVSARTEIGVRGDSALDNYFNLMARSDYPEDAPRLNPEDLKMVFATAVRRLERQVQFEDVVIESALDDMEILTNEQQTGDSIYDCVLFPIAVEHELEFELKGEISQKTLDKVYNWVLTECIKDNKVKITTDSKALRAMRRLKI